MFTRQFAAVLFAVFLLGQVTLGQETAAPDAKERLKAARSLRDGGTEAIQSLAPYLKDADVDVRREAVRSLVAIGTQYSLDPLIAATRDNDPEVQMRATDGIVNFYLPGYVPTGLAKYTSAVRGRFDRENRGVIDPWINVRPEVGEALAKLVRGGGSMESRANAARAVGILRSKSAIPELLQAMQTKDTTVLFEMLVAFQKIGDPSVGPRVVPLLRDLEERVQLAAIETTGILRAQEAVPDLRKVFDNAKSARVRRAALTSLAMMPDPKTRPYFERAFTDKDEKVRAAAAEGLGRLQQSGDTPMLEKAFEDEKKSAPRLANAFGLVMLGDRKTEELSALTYLVNTLNSRQYHGVAEPYLLELSRQPENRVAMYQYVAKATGEEKKALARIFAITGDNEAIKQVEWISKDSDAEVASEGLRALKALRARLN